METPSFVPANSDFAAVACSPAFRDLMRRRRRFVLTSLSLGLGWFGIFLALAAWNADVMGWVLHRGVPLAYAFGLSQFAVIWLITWAYLRRSARVFSPLEDTALGAVAPAPSAVAVAR